MQGKGAHGRGLDGRKGAGRHKERRKAPRCSKEKPARVEEKSASALWRKPPEMDIWGSREWYIRRARRREKASNYLHCILLKERRSH